jgi:class 3 adenylate cyclase/tetratricopeptide (TPR) repeat protein
MREIDDWLEQLGLGEYAETFARNDIDFDVLVEISEHDLMELGVSFGNRKRLLRAIREQLEPPDPAAAGTAPREQPAPDPLEDDAERRQITVLFCDLVGSTDLSSRLPLEDYRELLGSYQRTTRRIVSEFGGYVARYLGDGLLAYFGYPQAGEDDAERAITAATALVPAVSAIASPQGEALACRIGIATGTVVVGGSVEAGGSREKTVLGVTPNFAARLQAEADENQIIIAPSTLSLVGGRVATRVIDFRTLKGIAGETPIIEVLGVRDTTRFEAHTGGHLGTMVGRSAELDLLTRRWNDAVSGNGGACFVLGEAGLGKSRLVEQLISGIQQPHTVLRCSCSPQHQSTPFHPIAHELERLAGFSAHDSESVRRAKLQSLLGRISPPSVERMETFYKLLSLGAREETPEGSEQNFLAATEAALLEHLSWSAAQRPALVLFEDVHWADPSTHALVSRLVDRAPELRALVLVTQRPGAAGEVSVSPSMSVLNLTPLSRDESRELLHGLTDSVRLDSELEQVILDRADGVPLFLEQLVQTAAETASTGAVPATLMDSLMGRLDRLGDGKRVAQAAAVIGRNFPFGLLAELLDMPPRALREQLARLEQSRIVLQRGFGGEVEYQFSHALLRDAAYDSLLRERRRHMHHRAARALVGQGHETGERIPETIAYHHEAAGEHVEAVRYWELAGRRARQRSASLESATHFARAIELLGHEDAAARSERELMLRLELYGQLVAVHGNAAPEVMENYELARELLPNVRDRRLAFRARHHMRTFYMVRGQLPQARVLGDELLRLAREIDDPALLVQAHRAHGLCLFALGELDAGRRHLERSIELYRPEVHAVQRFEYASDPLVLARCNLGWAYAFLGRSGDAIEHVTGAVRRAEELEHRHSLAFALSIEACTRQALDDAPGTTAAAERAMALSQVNGYPYWIAWNRMLLAWAELAPDDGTLGDYERGIEEYERTGARMMLPYFFTLHGELLVRLRRQTQALDALRRAEEEVRGTGTAFYEAEVHRLRAEALAASGEAPELLRSSLLEATTIATREGNALLAARVERTVRERLGPRLSVAGPGGRA